MHITVVIPTFNRAFFLERAIKSVLDQTHQDFTIFISDNASSDETKSVVYKFNDKRIIYHCHDTNVGMQKNWEYCIRYSIGEYVALLEDDNYYKSNHLSEAINFINKYKISFYSCNSLLDNKPYVSKFSNVFIRNSTQLSLSELLFDINIPASGVVFHKNCINHIQFDLAYDLWCMDRFYWRSIIIKEGIIFNPNCNIVYTIHNNNITHSLLKNPLLRAKASAQNRFVDRFSILFYIENHPLKKDGIVEQFSNISEFEKRNIIPSFYSHNFKHDLIFIGDKLLDNYTKGKVFFFYRFLPTGLAKVLIKKINEINEFLGNWKSPII